MTDSVLIVGGGIAGLHAAMACTDAGARAVVVESGPVVGGKLAATMTRAAAIADRAEGASAPTIEALAKNAGIEIITLAKLDRLEGRPGNFTATITQRARLVTDACTRCKLCRAACPVVRSNEFDAGLTYRKAIYTPLSETLPAPYVIDLDSCLNKPPNYLPCQRCVEVCADDAIHFDLPLETRHERHVGAVILAPGFQIEGGARFSDLGYGKHPDIVMSAELQRLLESPGPTGGYASKPSNEAYPQSVLLVLDEPSAFALYIVASQVHQLLEQDVATVAVLILSQKGAAQWTTQVQKLADQTGVKLFWGGMFMVEPAPDNSLGVSFEDFAENRLARASYDLVVLCSEVAPPAGLAALAQTVGVDLAASGYVGQADGSDVATSRPGIYVAGCASGAKNIRASLAQASAAASAALAELNPRLLQAGDAAPRSEPPGAADSPPTADLRGQVEQLLYALLNRPGEG